MPSSHRKGTDSFSAALKDKTVAPPKLNPQTLFERENPKVRLMCDLNKIMVGHREFSFEEIRRQCYERLGRFPSKSPSKETPVTPISSAALLNVRSKEKGLKNRTPSDAAVAVPKVKTPKVISAPPPLKPNEKWHCDIGALYPEGRELSFEQLRALKYAAKVEVRQQQSPPKEAEVKNDQVEFKAPIPVITEPEVIAPALKEEPKTREIAVQTDLFGLEFDIVLVPRQQVVSSPPKQEVPKALSPTPPPTEQSGSGSGGSSPTVNTKQALSSVKSWFNSSVLVPESKVLEAKPAKKSLFAVYKDPSMVDVPDDKAQPASKPFAIFSEPEPVASKPFTVFAEPETPKPFAIFAEPENGSAVAQPKRFTVMDENVVDQENAISRAPVVKARKPLAAIVPLPTCPEIPSSDEEKSPDNFKENVPPTTYVQETVKRQLSGILVPSVDIPCDPAGLVEDEAADEEVAAAPSTVSRALFTGDDEEQTRHYCIPLTDDIDFTVPSAMAFANNLRIQSTPLMTRHQPLTQPTCGDEATFNLPRGRALQQVSDNVPVPSAPAAASKTLRGLSPIDEISREYFSSSGSSAGTTDLAHSRLSVGRNSHCVDAGRIFPAHFDPFDNDHRSGQLKQLAIPLEKRAGFHVISGRPPWLRSNSSIQLGENPYIVKQPIGQGAYAKVYEASADGKSVVLKVQESDGVWEFYITSELQRRLADAPTVISILNSYFFCC